MTGDDGPPVDTTPPTLVSSTPADGATKVSVITKLTFVFSEDLDPSTVTSAAFKLVQNHYTGLTTPSLSMHVATSYDAATHTVTVTPDRPMSYDGCSTDAAPDYNAATGCGGYVLDYGMGVKDAAGNAFAPGTLRFRTVINSMSKRTYYNSSTGAVSAAYNHALDAAGHVVKQFYESAGADQIFGNADDSYSSVQQWFYGADNQVTQQRGFAAGPDGKLNTNDDVISYLYTYTYDASGREIERTYISAPGPDAQWGTADDIIGNYMAIAYDASGMPTKETYYNSAGTDTVWHTADDRVSSWIVATNTGRNRTAWQYYEPGPDLLPMTSDDIEYERQEFTYDANGNATSLKDFYDKGPDMMWNTADDLQDEFISYTLDARGNSTAMKYTYGPGTDMIWGTPDDPINGYGANAFDVNECLSSVSNFNTAGADMTWGTADDVLGSHVDSTYSATGNRTGVQYLNGVGPDNVWRTGDDRVAYKYDYDQNN